MVKSHAQNHKLPAKPCCSIFILSMPGSIYPFPRKLGEKIRCSRTCVVGRETKAEIGVVQCVEVGENGLAICIETFPADAFPPLC